MFNEEKRNITEYTYNLDLQLFADGGGDDDDKKPDDVNDDKGGGNGADGSNGADDKTFTQAELDRILADRLERERKKFADYDELKTKLSEFEQAEAERQKAAMTEQERLAAEKAEAERKAQEAEDRAAQALKSANERLIKAEFMLKARKANIREDALEDAFKLADISGVTVGDDGATSGVDEVVSALVASKSFLLEVKTAQPKIIGDNGGPGTDDDVKTLEQQLEDAKKKRDFSKVIELSNKIAKLQGGN